MKVGRFFEEKKSTLYDGHMRLNAKKVAALNIIIALIFAGTIIVVDKFFVSLSDDARNWIVVVWSLFFFSLSGIATAHIVNNEKNGGSGGDRTHGQ